MPDVRGLIDALRTIRRDQRGASAVEYGLLVAGIAALIVAVVFLFGGFVTGIFDDSCDTVRAEVEGTCEAGAGD